MCIVATLLCIGQAMAYNNFSLGANKDPITTTRTTAVLDSVNLYLEWDSDVSCQKTRDRDKEKTNAAAAAAVGDGDYIEDGECIRVCELSTVGYNLAGDTSYISSTTWLVSGGTISSQTSTTCNVAWGAMNTTQSSITAVSTLTDGTIKETEICIEKVGAPTAAFAVGEQTVDIRACLEDEVDFTNLSSSADGHTTLYYQWDFGDGTYSTAFEPSHQYTAPGVYEVILIVSNGCGCIDSYTTRVIISPGIGPIECPSVVCEGQQAIYKIMNYDPSCDYDWMAQGGTILNNNGGTATIVWDHVDPSGFGEITVRSSCSDCEVTLKVPVVQQDGTIEGPTEICEGEQFTYSLPQWPTTEFNWSILASTSGTTLITNDQRNEIVLQAGSAGTILLRCEYNNALLGCGGTASLEITINPSATIIGDSPVCFDTTNSYTVEYNGATITPDSWVLEKPNGSSTTSSGTTFTETFNLAGTYVLQAIDDNYCIGAKTIKVYADVPTPAGITGDILVCPTASNVYSATSVPDGVTPHWSVDHGTIIGSSTSTDATITFDPAFEDYVVTLYYEKNGCESDAITYNVEKDVPTITFTQAQDTVCGSSFQTYTIDPVADADSYVWTIYPSTAGSVYANQNTNSVEILWNEPPTGSNSMTAEVTATVKKCGEDYAESYEVTVVTSPEVTISAPSSTMCAEDEQTYTLTVAGGMTPSSVEWNFNGDIVVDDATVDYAFPQPTSNNTTVTVTATATFASGCQAATDTFTVTLYQTPVVSLSPETLHLNACDPSLTTADYTYTVTAQTGFGATTGYQWYFSTSQTGTGSPISGENTDTIDLSQQSNYGYYYAVVSNSYCSSETERIYYYYSCGAPNTCTVNETLSATYTNSACGEATININASGSPINVYLSPLADLYDYVDVGASTFSQIIVTDVPPGEYSVDVIATYNIGGGETCSIKYDLTVTIPYEAGVKYNIVCNGNGTYDLEVLDASQEYAPVGISNYQFTKNGGSTWTSASSSTSHTYTSLAPGTYEIGVKISTSGYPACTAFDTIEIIDIDNIDFTWDTECLGQSIPFTPSIVDSSLTYEWDFNGTGNYQPLPTFNFGLGGITPVTLTITNEFGCSNSVTHGLSITDPLLDGDLSITPSETCEGEAVTITYNNNINGNMPDAFEWYKDGVLLGTTTTGSYTVNNDADGHYYVYVSSNEGCFSHLIQPTDVNQIPLPDAPVITGNDGVCLGSAVTLSVPDNPELTYYWTVDGVADSAYDGLTEITDVPSTTGLHTYGVAAAYSNGSTTCTGPERTFTVEVTNPVNTPYLSFNVVGCDPYEVEVTVTNVESGVDYYWSNGDTGTSTTMYHDGAIQVRAQRNDCTATNQITLPTDLQAVAWIFPEGCFDDCIKRNPTYIVGPLGTYSDWAWILNGGSVSSGSGTVANYPLSQSGVYQLTLDNGYCHINIGDMDYTADGESCNPCDIKYEYKAEDVKCMESNGGTFVEIFYSAYNPGPTAVTLTVTPFLVSSGYTANNSITLLPGNASSGSFYFFPASGVSGSSVMFNIQAVANGAECSVGDFSITIPNCGNSKMAQGAEAEMTEIQLMAAPNPVQESTTLYYKTASKAATTLTVTALSGKTMTVKTLTDSEGVLQLYCNHWQAGTYVVALQQNGKVIKTLKLVVQ
ncbi:hypothetical protein Y10_31810 [Neptunitalea sp. Y10]|uniref:PKD domain-containing protein n=2 Tax=Neptunitalea lumnitzerae TaxID=2965509 RepID=A0ABQ5MN42_9FLAO|nr:hypothetical protein Y10_31810 [Neptunitalea sp. Y10]